jgi:hypothetical protein
VPNLASIFLCLRHSKESVQVWGPVQQCITSFRFETMGFQSAPRRAPNSGGTPLFCCSRLLIQYIMACRFVARQRPWNKQLYNRRC